MREEKFSSLTKAWNYLRSLKKLVKKVKKSKSGSQDELGVQAGGHTNKERLAYASYCISLLSNEDYPHYSQKEFHVNLLTSLLRGYSREYLAKMSGCTIKVFEMHEKEANQRVKDAIERTMKRKTPIVGGIMPRESEMVGYQGGEMVH